MKNLTTRRRTIVEERNDEPKGDQKEKFLRGKRKKEKLRGGEIYGHHVTPVESQQQANPEERGTTKGGIPAFTRPIVRGNQNSKGGDVKNQKKSVPTELWNISEAYNKRR